LADGLVYVYSSAIIASTHCKMGGIIRDQFLQPHGFDRSENGGWEKVLAPNDERWVRRHASEVFVGNADEMDPMIDGPPQDKLIRNGVYTDTELQQVIAEVCQ
jgi:hypothetical protein